MACKAKENPLRGKGLFAALMIPGGWPAKPKKTRCAGYFCFHRYLIKASFER
jgi:hypothetical protein